MTNICKKNVVHIFRKNNAQSFVIFENVNSAFTLDLDISKYQSPGEFIIFRTTYIYKFIHKEKNKSSMTCISK